MTGWKPIATAPKDGTLFIARNADHPNWGAWPAMRYVIWAFSDIQCQWLCKDMGAWIYALDNTPDPDGHAYQGGPSVPFSLAADQYNRSVRLEWMPLPGKPMPDAPEVG